MTQTPRQQSLWRDANFIKKFTARTSARFGALLGGLVYAAILVLDARPSEMAALTVFGTAPALIFGLSAGAWADRVNSLFNVSEVAMTLVGAVVGGVVAETAGLRAAIAVATTLIVVSSLVLLVSPVRRVQSAEAVVA